MGARKFFLICLGVIGIAAFLMAGVQREPVEKLAISAGVGYDIEKKMSGDIEHSLPMAIYNLTENNKTSKIYTGKAPTIMETRGDRQRKLDRKFLLGFEKVYIISEEQARLGIREIIETLFVNPLANDTGFVCVCNGKAEDILKFKVEDYPSSADFIEGLIRYSTNYNFFPKNYKMMDAYLRVDAEGRNLVVPYIELKENGIRISGVAIFNKDKMVNKADFQDTIILNLLRESNITGGITLEKDDKDYLNMFGKCKRKVKCYKEGNKYTFIINLDFKGDIVSNEMYKKMISNQKEKEKAEKDLAKSLEKKANTFIERMKNEYKIDCLELGRIAAAKYGRNTGVDWNEIVTNAEIKVNAKIVIDKLGRGSY